MANVIGTKTIKLKRYNEIEIERVANATIYPGMLIELMTTDKVRAHNTASRNVTPKMFALEDELQGHDIDTAYAANDRVKCGIFRPGDVVYGILADGQDIDIGDPLESAGGGLLQEHVVDTADSEQAIAVYSQSIVGIALEAVDTSASSGEESSLDPLGYARRIKVMIT